jgi:AcrR family transcriptional regulator
MNVINAPFNQPKWTRKPKARPDEALQAALDVFAVNGFAAPRMEDIAKAAGLSKAAIYLYFPSKDDVFKALVAQRIGVLQAHLTAQSSFWDFFWPQAMRGSGLILCFATLSTIALGTMPPHKIQSASGLFNLTRNLGGAIGLAVLSTMNDYFTVFHRTELGSAMNVGDPLLADRLAASAANLSAQGVANPEIAALAQQVQLFNREAAVMTFNKLFVLIAGFLALSILVIPLLTRAKPGQGSG